jgi:hypothetical protein
MEISYAHREYTFRLRHREITLLIDALEYLVSHVPSDAHFAVYVGWQRNDVREFVGELREFVRSTHDPTVS